MWPHLTNSRSMRCSTTLPSKVTGWLKSLRGLLWPKTSSPLDSSVFSPPNSSGSTSKLTTTTPAAKPSQVEGLTLGGRPLRFQLVVVVATLRVRTVQSIRPHPPTVPAAQQVSTRSQVRSQGLRNPPRRRQPTTCFSGVRVTQPPGVRSGH